MRSRCTRLVYGALIAYAVGSFSAAQGQTLRDLARERGDIQLGPIISCGPPVGIKEVVDHTQLTIEGLVSKVESSLTEKEDDVYTDYDIDVVRLFRAPSQTVTRSSPGATDGSPFIVAEASTRPAATGLRVRLRRPHQGRVVVEGGSISATSGFPMLTVGQHVIVSAYFSNISNAWVPLGVFDVRGGRVVHLERDLQTHDYDSVEAFAAALANPPPTVIR